MHSLTLPRLMTRRFTRSQSPSFEAFQRCILEWQAAHPNITWIGWAIV
jgi:hypothetical protein